MKQYKQDYNNSKDEMKKKIIINKVNEQIKNINKFITSFQ